MDLLRDVCLWAGCIFMSLAFIAFGIIGSKKATETSRIFYYRGMIVASLSAFGYVLMINHTAIIRIDHDFYLYLIRFLEWALTTPLLLIQLNCLVRPLNGDEGKNRLIVACFCGVSTVTAGLFFSLFPESTHWLLWCICIFSLAVVESYIFSFWGNARKLPRHSLLGQKVRVLSLYIAIIWILYPVIFNTYVLGLFDGSIDSVLFLILDISAKIGINMILLWGPLAELVSKFDADLKELVA